MNTDIRLSVTFWDHPKTIKLIRALGLEGAVSLQRLWLWATQDRPDGVLSGMNADDIEIAAKWNGAQNAFYEALTALRFVDNENGVCVLHNWADHNPWQAEAEARSEKARNAAKARWKNAQAPNKQCKRDAQAMQVRCSSNAQALNEQCPSPLLSSPEEKGIKTLPLPLAEGERESASAEQPASSPLTPRQTGTNARAKESNPRAKGANPRATGENPRSVFVPPEPAEVEAYCHERQNGISGREFCDFYAAKGWMVGKTRMRDWKAAVRTWEHKRKEERQTLERTRASPFIMPLN